LNGPSFFAPLVNFLSTLAFLLVPLALPILYWVAFFRWLGKLVKINRSIQVDTAPASPDDVVGLDREALHELTSELESLGFETKTDTLRHYRLDNPSPSRASASSPPIPDPRVHLEGASRAPALSYLPTEFVRTLVHPTQGCLGRISYVTYTMTGRQKPSSSWLHVEIVSFSGLGDEDWVYSTSNAFFPARFRQTSKLFRHPRRLYTRLAKQSALETFNFHIVRRGDIAQAGAIRWKSDLANSDHQLYEARVLKDVHDGYRKISLLVTAVKLMNPRGEPHNFEWLGELRGKVPHSTPT
jgi:hypothetical protein